MVREKRGKKTGTDSGRKLPAAQLFSATPPSECIKMLATIMVQKQVSIRGKRLAMRIWDIKRAHFYGKAQREIYIELPEEEQDGVHCGLCLKSWYGTQDASHIFQHHYTNILEGDGHNAGLAIPALCPSPAKMFV